MNSVAVVGIVITMVAVGILLFFGSLFFREPEWQRTLRSKRELAEHKRVAEEYGLPYLTAEGVIRRPEKQSEPLSSVPGRVRTKRLVDQVSAPLRAGYHECEDHSRCVEIRSWEGTVRYTCRPRPQPTYTELEVEDARQSVKILSREYTNLLESYRQLKEKHDNCASGSARIYYYPGGPV